MATKDPKAGDKVSWKSPQGEIKGTVEKKLTAPTDIKTHHVAASPANPQFLVKSRTTGQKAAHKAQALKKDKGE